MVTRGVTIEFDIGVFCEWVLRAIGGYFARFARGTLYGVGRGLYLYGTYDGYRGVGAYRCRGFQCGFDLYNVPVSTFMPGPSYVGGLLVRGYKDDYGRNNGGGAGCNRKGWCKMGLGGRFCGPFGDEDARFTFREQRVFTAILRSRVEHFRYFRLHLFTMGGPLCGFNYFSGTRHICQRFRFFHFPWRLLGQRPRRELRTIQWWFL